MIVFGIAGNGGAEGDRTPDLRIANATLSQLSYGPISLDNSRQRPRFLGGRTMGIAPCAVKRGAGPRLGRNRGLQLRLSAV